MKTRLVQIYKKHKEIVDYLIAGGLTTAVSIILFYGSVWTVFAGTDAFQFQRPIFLTCCGDGYCMRLIP